MSVYQLYWDTQIKTKFTDGKALNHTLPLRLFKQKSSDHHQYAYFSKKQVHVNQYYTPYHSSNFYNSTHKYHQWKSNQYVPHEEHTSSSSTNASESDTYPKRVALVVWGICPREMYNDSISNSEIRAKEGVEKALKNAGFDGIAFLHPPLHKSNSEVAAWFRDCDEFSDTLKYTERHRMFEMARYVIDASLKVNAELVCGVSQGAVLALLAAAQGSGLPTVTWGGWIPKLKVGDKLVIKQTGEFLRMNFCSFRFSRCTSYMYGIRLGRHLFRKGRF
jgi:hypothetical protein